MHLASLVGVEVVSIWGATHPYAGFYGDNQNPLNAVQVNLACRPCSVFGNKPCWRGDHACMQQITTEMIINQIQTQLNQRARG
jgi:ADP-heptose:LPS heptosyltransferase